MNASQFAQLAAEGYNRIPVVRQVLADLETPLGVYLKLAQGSYSYFLESMQGGEKWGRYSFIGMPCATVLTATHDAAGSGCRANISVQRDGVEVESCIPGPRLLRQVATAIGLGEPQLHHERSSISSRRLPNGSRT